MKKIIFLIFSFNLILSGSPLKARSFEEGFFLGSMGAFCGIYVTGELDETTARKYIRWTINYHLKEDKDIEIRKYAKNYRFPTGSSYACNRLLP